MKYLSWLILFAIMFNFNLGCDDEFAQTDCERVRTGIKHDIGQKSFHHFFGGQTAMESIDLAEKEAIAVCGQSTITNEVKINTLKKWAATEAWDQYQGMSQWKPRTYKNCKKACPSWYFNAVEERTLALKKTLEKEFGMSLSETKVTELMLDVLNKKYKAGYHDQLVNELRLYPTTMLPESPMHLYSMISETHSLTDEESKELGKLKSEAYARLAEKELHALRQWSYEFPQTLEHIATMREYLQDGGLSLATIGTGEKELTYLERRRPHSMNQRTIRGH